jgi:sortase (surface protein transpeptidase)
LNSHVDLLIFTRVFQVKQHKQQAETKKAKQRQAKQKKAKKTEQHKQNKQNKQKKAKKQQASKAEKQNKRFSCMNVDPLEIPLDLLISTLNSTLICTRVFKQNNIQAKQSGRTKISLA